ncbi:MAG: hypothetical protein ACREEE_18360, partial [Dongiaceae bacterium]
MRRQPALRQKEFLLDSRVLRIGTHRSRGKSEQDSKQNPSNGPGHRGPHRYPGSALEFSLASNPWRALSNPPGRASAAQSAFIYTYLRSAESAESSCRRATGLHRVPSCRALQFSMSDKGLRAASAIYATIRQLSDSQD